MISLIWKKRGFYMTLSKGLFVKICLLSYTDLPKICTGALACKSFWEELQLYLQAFYKGKCLECVGSVCWPLVHHIWNISKALGSTSPCCLQWRALVLFEMMCIDFSIINFRVTAYDLPSNLNINSLVTSSELPPFLSLN